MSDITNIDSRDYLRQSNSAVITPIKANYNAEFAILFIDNRNFALGDRISGYE